MLAPFKIDIGDAVLADLSERLARTRLPDATGFDDWEDGTPLGYVGELVAHWRSKFDWRAQEADLNRFTQLRGDIAGTQVHTIHERGRGPNPMPLLLVHGWPDGIWRFRKLIPLLTDPGAHGGDPADAFDVIAPSLPGYGWSQTRANHGGVFGFGDVLAKLMAELGYDTYGAHGGDWGSVIVEQLARDHAKQLHGIHLTDVPWTHAMQPPKDPSPAEQKYLDRSKAWQMKSGAYSMIQGTRPATPAAALNDSPAGLAAWIVEKLWEWSDGPVDDVFGKDEILTNATIYWATGTIGSSFLPYRDAMKAGPARWVREGAKGLVGSDRTPTALALFPKDINTAPREWGERFFNVQRYIKFKHGGHFAAFERPEDVAADLRDFFRAFR